jgi:hypothetical protein
MCRLGMLRPENRDFEKANMFKNATHPLYLLETGSRL